jgi:hypothetical protein
MQGFESIRLNFVDLIIYVEWGVIESKKVC